MGRYYSSKKEGADYLKKISVPWLHKFGYFCGHKSGAIIWTNNATGKQSSIGIEVSMFDGDGHLRIHYTQTNNYTSEEKDFNYKIPLTTTPCRYGGKRYWFICPWYKNSVYCGKRVGTLYKDGDYFACRHCYNLTYSSRKQNRRYNLFPLFNVLTIEKKIDELHERIKRPYYAGRPTKRQRRLEMLYRQAGLSYQRYTKLK